MYEIGYARAHGIPIVMLVQETGNVHNHVFLTNSATYVVRNLTDAIAVSKFLLLASPPKMEAFHGLDESGNLLPGPTYSSRRF